ncbi:hypothetical protein DFH09DRAFT_1068691 [Mycena vulgaris]|nr:hypothetical protein DFH09DRAFT_1068691 [Mycena vulgaris]
MSLQRHNPVAQIKLGQGVPIEAQDFGTEFGKSLETASLEKKTLKEERTLRPLLFCARAGAPPSAAAWAVKRAAGRRAERCKTQEGRHRLTAAILPNSGGAAGASGSGAGRGGKTALASKTYCVWPLRGFAWNGRALCGGHGVWCMECAECIAAGNRALRREGSGNARRDPRLENESKIHQIAYPTPSPVHPQRLTVELQCHPVSLRESVRLKCDDHPPHAVDVAEPAHPMRTGCHSCSTSVLWEGRGKMSKRKIATASDRKMKVQLDEAWG